MLQECECWCNTSYLVLIWMQGKEIHNQMDEGLKVTQMIVRKIMWRRMLQKYECRCCFSYLLQIREPDEVEVRKEKDKDWKLRRWMSVRLCKERMLQRYGLRHNFIFSRYQGKGWNMYTNRWRLKVTQMYVRKVMQKKRMLHWYGGRFDFIFTQYETRERLKYVSYWMKIESYVDDCREDHAKGECCRSVNVGKTLHSHFLDTNARKKLQYLKKRMWVVKLT